MIKQLYRLHSHSSSFLMVKMHVSHTIEKLGAIKKTINTLTSILKQTNFSGSNYRYAIALTVTKEQKTCTGTEQVS